MLRRIIKHRKIILIVAVFTAVYFISRIVNLTALPIFTDEAIYIRWAQIAKQDANWRFISLTDGKQPLFVWGTMVILRFINDPLAAGRLTSVIAGFFSLIGIGLLTRELFKSNRMGVFASLLYLIYPFALVYDRMALMDSMAAMFSIWALYFSILLVKTLRLDVALILGMILGGGLLTKTIGFISIYLLPTTLLLFDWQRKKRLHRLSKWLGLALIAVVLSQLYYGILRLSPWFHMIAQKDTTFVFSMKEWLNQPYRFFHGNIQGEADWVLSYSTYPLALLYILAFPALIALPIFRFWRPESHNLLLLAWFIFPLYFLWRARKQKEKLLLYLWFIVPFTGLAVFGKVLYPRFVFFMTMPLLILAAWTLNHIYKYFTSHVKMRSIFYVVFFILFIYPLYSNTKILFSTLTAPIPSSDRNQYINDWPSGWGIREAVDILKIEAEEQEIAIFTEGNFGLLPYGIEIYLVDNPNIEIIGLWPIPENYTEEMIEKIEKKPVYYISNKFQDLREKWNGEIVGEWQKGIKEDRKLKLWKLKPIDEK